MAHRLDVVMLVAVIGLAGCGIDYHGDAIEGRVVDAETRQPVADVIVVSEWRLEGGLHTDVVGHLVLQETATDAAGRYRFPAWGPIPKPEYARLQASTPVLNFYKPGYEFLIKRNEGFGLSKKPAANGIVSELDGATIELVPHRGALDNKGHSREFGSCCYIFSIDEKKCGWRQIPRMTAVLMKRGEEYRKAEIPTAVPYESRLRQGGRCPNPEYELREYLK